MSVPTTTPPTCVPHPEGPCETIWTSQRTGVTQIQRFTYESGRLVLRETRRADSPVRTSRRTYTYDERGFLVREVGETPRGSGWTRYVRDEHGNAIETGVSPDGRAEESVETHVFTLDADGRVAIDERWALPRYVDGRIGTRRERAGSITYTRDAEGRVRTSSEESGGIPVRVCTSDYDQHGTLSRLECRYEGRGSITVFTYPAEYDACGNLIARRELRASGEESERWEHRYECEPAAMQDWVVEPRVAQEAVGPGAATSGLAE